MILSKTAKRITLGLSIWSGFGIMVAVGQMPPPPTPTVTPSGSPSQVPLDGGVLLLAAAGAAYGAQKVYGRKKADK